eukprot:PhM_4_TR7660/c0_g1_i1/m.63319
MWTIYTSFLSAFRDSLLPTDQNLPRTLAKRLINTLSTTTTTTTSTSSSFVAFILTLDVPLLDNNNNNSYGDAEVLCETLRRQILQQGEEEEDQDQRVVDQFGVMCRHDVVFVIRRSVKIPFRVNSSTFHYISGTQRCSLLEVCVGDDGDVFIIGRITSPPMTTSSLGATSHHFHDSCQRALSEILDRVYHHVCFPRRSSSSSNVHVILSGRRQDVEDVFVSRKTVTAVGLWREVVLNNQACASLPHAPFVTCCPVSSATSISTMSSFGFFFTDGGRQARKDVESVMVLPCVQMFSVEQQRHPAPAQENRDFVNKEINLRKEFVRQLKMGLGYRTDRELAARIGCPTTVHRLTADYVEKNDSFIFSLLVKVAKERPDAAERQPFVREFLETHATY